MTNVPEAGQNAKQNDNTRRVKKPMTFCKTKTKPP